jgi:hypothetical protein
MVIAPTNYPCAEESVRKVACPRFVVQALFNDRPQDILN